LEKLFEYCGPTVQGDNISGKLSDDRFIKLSRDYKQEQDQLKTVVETLGQEVIQQEQKKTNVRKFISIVEGMEEIGKLLATKMYGYGAEYGE